MGVPDQKQKKHVSSHIRYDDGWFGVIFDIFATFVGDCLTFAKWGTSMASAACLRTLK